MKIVLGLLFAAAVALVIMVIVVLVKDSNQAARCDERGGIYVDGYCLDVKELK